jgi:hypothetical protein
MDAEGKQESGWDTEEVNERREEENSRSEMVLD